MAVDCFWAAVSLVQKVTFLDDSTCIALLGFKMEVSDLLGMVDGEESDDPAAVTVRDGAKLLGAWFNAKPGVGVRLQLSIFGHFRALNRSFLRSFKRALAAPLVVSSFTAFLNFGLKACPLSASW